MPAAEGEEEVDSEPGEDASEGMAAEVLRIAELTGGPGGES